MAIICWMADGKDWLLGADLQAVRKELRDVKDWLAAVQQKKQAPSSSRAKTPMAQEPTDVPKSPRGEVDASNEGVKARKEAETDKAASPLQSAKKQVSKVSEADQVEHILAGGQWEGLGAVCKGGEIRIEVRPRPHRIGNVDTDVVHRAVWYFRQRNVKRVSMVTMCARDSSV